MDATNNLIRGKRDNLFDLWDTGSTNLFYRINRQRRKFYGTRLDYFTGFLEDFSISHLREGQMEAFSGRSWITVIKKTQTALQSQPHMTTGQCPGRRAETEGVRDQILNTLYQVFSVSLLSWGWVKLCWVGVQFLPSFHSVEIWLLLLIRFSVALAELI